MGGGEVKTKRTELRRKVEGPADRGGAVTGVMGISGNLSTLIFEGSKGHLVRGLRIG